jgi:peptidoglycan/LPS O-acetylase OafA/YrhL
MADQRLQWLEAMRGMAAVWVALHHGQQSAQHFLGLASAPAIFRHGYLGVDFFFVLSGFIIMFSGLRLRERGGGLKQYLQARLLRIYVPYLPVGLVMYAAYMLLPSFSEGARGVSLLTSLTLIPAFDPPALSVAWTLVHEMIFYALFAVWFISPRAFWGGVLAWTACIVASHLTGEPLTRFASYFLSPLNLCFICGVGLCLLCRRVSFPAPASALLAIGGIGLVLVQATSELPNRLLVAAGFAALIAAATSQWARQLVVSPLLTMLGAASYSVYLLHNPALSLAARGIRALHANPWAGYALLVTAALGAGILYWWAYERRALRMVRSWLAPNANRVHLNSHESVSSGQT